ncbi:MAG: hypothetical protein RSC97_03710, partial [Eubacterium sp.]
FDLLKIGRYSYFMNEANKITVFICALSMFLFFRTIKIPYNKWINRIASSTLGVLLIHANSDTMRQFLWKDVLKNTEFYASPWLCVHLFMSCILIYVICTMIDQIRMNCLEKPIFKMLEKYTDHFKRIYNGVNQYINKIIKY